MLSRRDLAIVVALLLVAALGACTDEASAPDAAPSASPTDLASTEPAPQTVAPKRSYLFAHDAGAAAISKLGGDRYEIALREVPNTALYFEDRPGRAAGSVPIEKMLKGLFGKEGGDAPNAAITAVDASGAQQMMAVELLSGTFDAGNLVYEVRYLAPSGRDSAHYVDEALTGEFGDVSVFIDTIYNECGGAILNYTTTDLSFVSGTKYSHDDWIHNPPATLPAPDLTKVYSSASSIYDGVQWIASWQSESAFARGCWNTVVYGITDVVTVTVNIADPYSGANTYTCTVQQPNGGTSYECIGPNKDSSTSGDTVSATFILCSQDQSLIAFKQIPVDQFGDAVDFDCGYLQTELVDNN